MESEAKRLKHLENENRKPKHLVTELSRITAHWRTYLQKTGRACGTSSSCELYGEAVRDERAARLQLLELSR